MCIQFSAEEIGEAIFRPGENGDADLLELVDQLLSCDVAMWVFADTIADIYGPGEIADCVRAAVSQHLAKPLLSREQRRELHQLCHNLAILDIQQLFAMSIDHVGHTMQSDPSNLRAVLNELEQFPDRARDGLPPIAVFVAILADAQPAEVRERLHAWVAELVGPGMLRMAVLDGIRSSQQGPRETRGKYCAIHLDPDDIDPSLWYLSVYLQEGQHPGEAPTVPDEVPYPRERVRARIGEAPDFPPQAETGPGEPLVAPDDVPYPEEQVRARIGDALNSPLLAGISPSQIRIEFFLPNILISLPVDQWRIGAAALGVQYQVVVRSATRLQDLLGSHVYWQEKWSLAKWAEFSGAASIPQVGFRATDSVTWLTEQAVQHNPDQVYVALTDREGPVCLLLAQPPGLRHGQHGQALYMALAAGIPVLLWSRDPGVDLSNGLPGLIAAGVAPLMLRDLPALAFAFRRAAARHGVGQNHLARHLTLLYDDAGRIPPPASPLRMPT